MSIGIALVVAIGAAIPLGFLAVMTRVGNADFRRAKAARNSLRAKN
jgi:hypothetical protein